MPPMMSKSGDLKLVMALFFLLLSLPIVLVFVNLNRTQLFHNLKLEKVANADYNAESAANAALASLKWRIDQLNNRLPNGIVLADGTTQYISVEQLSNYIDQKHYVEFFTDWLNDFDGHPDFKVASSTDPYSAYSLSEVINSTNSWTAEVRLIPVPNTSQDKGCRWETGYADNSAYLVFNYEILSTGKLSSYDSNLTSEKGLRLAGREPVEVHLKRTLSKYNYFASTGSYNGNPVWFRSAAADPCMFNGPVHTNDFLYLRRNPGFADSVSSAKGPYYFNNGLINPVSGTAQKIDPITGKFYDIPVFNKGLTIVPAVSLTNTLGKDQQKYIAAGGIDLSSDVNGVYKSTTTPAVYVKGGCSIEIEKSKSDPGKVIYVISPTNKGDFSEKTIEQVIASQPQFLIYVDGVISGLAGELEKGARITIAAELNIILSGDLLYDNDDDTKAKTVIGLISWENDILISKDVEDNITVNASIMATKGGFGVEDLESITGFRGEINLNGGLIIDHPMPTLRDGKDGFGFKTTYDTYLKDIKAPPYFPGNGRYELEPINGEPIEGVKDSYKVIDPNVRIEL